MQARVLFFLLMFTGPALWAAPSPKGSGQAAPPPAVTGSGSPYAPNVGGEPPHIVMVTVGGEEITIKDYLAYVQANMDRAREGETQEGKAAVVKALVSDRILRKQIIKEGLVPKAKEDDDKAMIAGYRKLAEKHFPPPPPPSAEEARAYYEAHRDEYGIPVMWRVSQIQFRVSHGASVEMRDKVKAKADAALQRIKNGEDFGKVAAELTEYSDGRSRRGDLGFLPLAALPLPKEVLAAMKLDEPTGVVDTPSGYEILMKTDQRPERISPFEQVKERVEKKMIAQGQAQMRDAYLAEVTRDEPVVVVQDLLKPYFPKGMFPTEPVNASSVPLP